MPAKAKPTSTVRRTTAGLLVIGLATCGTPGPAGAQPAGGGRTGAITAPATVSAQAAPGSGPAATLGVPERLPATLGGPEGPRAGLGGPEGPHYEVAALGARPNWAPDAQGHRTQSALFGPAFGSGSAFGNSRAAFGSGPAFGNSWVFGGGQSFGNGRASGDGWAFGNGQAFGPAPVGYRPAAGGVGFGAGRARAASFDGSGVSGVAPVGGRGVGRDRNVAVPLPPPSPAPVLAAPRPGVGPVAGPWHHRGRCGR